VIAGANENQTVRRPVNDRDHELVCPRGLHGGHGTPWGYN
jgi:hypothetical protein